MNFTTDLPKRNPLVSYIVASAVRCAKLFPEEANKQGPPVYRMHAVILKINGSNIGEDGRPKRELYICCHVRRVFEGNEQEKQEEIIMKEVPAKLKQQSSKNSGTYPLDSQNLFHFEK